MNAQALRWLAIRSLALCLLVSSAGCMAPMATSYLSGSRKPEAAVESHAADLPTVAPNSPAAAAIRKASAEEPVSHDQALAGVLGELREIRAIDPAAEQQLMADLEQANPEHYPLIVEAFRTALVYRKGLAERERAKASEMQLAAATPYDSASRPPKVAKSPRQQVSASPRAVENAPVYAAAAAAIPHLPDDTTPTAHILPSSTPPQKPLLAEAAVASDGEDSHVHSVVHATPANNAATAAPGNWHVELDAAIVDLEKAVSPQPRSVDELHDHMRLRTLQLLAGQEEAAYHPIPGASPAQQDYWAKQLFAMSAYLNSAAQLDDKQRAAAALTPLDEARAKLSELATLQIRNLAFAESVDGFGAYKPRKAGPFQPGEPVTIYAEVENFQSTSSEAGYRTSLGTSYQVLDQSGSRVEGRQFPDVTDVCRNRRRDFHMQYGIALPKRIYPGPYRLELTITDHHSGKIGTATLPFEIAGDR